MHVRKTTTPKIDPAIIRAIEAAAEKAAKRATNRAVKHVLLELGIQAETPSGIIEQQKDAAFTRRVRLTAESTPAKLGLASFAAFLSVIGGLIVLAVRYFIDHHWK